VEIHTTTLQPKDQIANKVQKVAIHNTVNINNLKNIQKAQTFYISVVSISYTAIPTLHLIKKF